MIMRVRVKTWKKSGNLVPYSESKHFNTFHGSLNLSGSDFSNFSIYRWFHIWQIPEKIPEKTFKKPTPHHGKCASKQRYHLAVQPPQQPTSVARCHCRKVRRTRPQSCQSPPEKSVVGNEKSDWNIIRMMWNWWWNWWWYSYINIANILESFRMIQTTEVK